MNKRVFLTSKNDKQASVIEQEDKFIVEYCNKDKVMFTNILMKHIDTHSQKRKAIEMAKEYTHTNQFTLV